VQGVENTGRRSYEKMKSMKVKDLPARFAEERDSQGDSAGVWAWSLRSQEMVAQDAH
jgi:hypothetical protein